VTHRGYIVEGLYVITVTHRQTDSTAKITADPLAENIYCRPYVIGIVLLFSIFVSMFVCRLYIN